MGAKGKSRFDIRETMDWLYRDQLRVDREWSVCTGKGFTWWADWQAQTIEVIGELKLEGDVPGYVVSVRTDMLRDVPPDERLLDPMQFLFGLGASLSGPVYDTKTRTLRLCSLAVVHEENAAWMRKLIGMAAVLQIGEAGRMAPNTTTLFESELDVTGHPDNGRRPEPDELASITENAIKPLGELPCRWTTEEFEETLHGYMMRPPSIGSTGGEGGLAAEFPFGKDTSSLLQMEATRRHPVYGNGLQVTQSFYAPQLDGEAGIRLAMDLNRKDLLDPSQIHGLGSYYFGDGVMHFCSFLPNAIHFPGLLPNLYYIAAVRARIMSVRLTGEDWDEDSFAFKRSSFARRGVLDFGDE